MIVVWSGLGWLVFVVPAVFGVLAEFLLVLLASDGNPVVRHKTGFLIGLLGAAALWPLGRLLHADNRPPFDPVTGNENQPLPRHSLFWIPVEFWGVILPVLGLVTWLKG